MKQRHLVVRVKPDLYTAMLAKAKKEEVSLSSATRILLQDWVDGNIIITAIRINGNHLERGGTQE